MNPLLNKLPIGLQTFSEIRKNDCLYMDKTEYIYRLTSTTTKYYFLSRPRRFGKSLLTSTLKAFFAGQRELFQGLAIEKLEKEWVEYPVLHFDMSTAKHKDVEGLELELSGKLTDYEKIYGSSEPDKPNLNQRLEGLIERAHAQTGQQVVVLIDEYDAPLLDVVHEEENLPKLRQVMRNFYSPLKACDPHLRFVFLTGITKFSQMSIFSELNNLVNISMKPEFAAICGFTKEEILENMHDHLVRLAERQGITFDEAVNKLTETYDGYHFTWPSPDIFNPFSVLNCMSDCSFNYYWFASGTPTYLIEMMRKFDVAPSDLQCNEADAADFDAPTETMTSILPLLYQSGYITIKDYSPDCELYTLMIPNKEIRVGLLRSLLPHYTMGSKMLGNTVISKMFKAITKNDLETFFTLLRDFLLSIPYCENTHYEGHYQQLLYVILSLLGRYVDVEVRTNKGRIDLVMQAAGTLYLMELKVGQSAEAALQQIDLKQYPERFALSGLPIVRIGLNFDMETRTIADWQIIE